jgi:hypothetical protein
VVECDLAKVEVAGSNPVSRSRNTASDAKILQTGVSGERRFCAFCGEIGARSPSGKAEVCKTSIGGSIPPRASKQHLHLALSTWHLALGQSSHTPS